MSNNKDYSLLHKATISYEYLHTNSTTHEFVFGAIAELADNSRDADAKNFHIDFDAGKQLISFMDDGVGMSPVEATSVMAFGHSLKKHEIGKIGQYGNGLKSGAMRLAKDFIIFTKRDYTYTALLLSRTFHEASHIQEILVPAPVFNDKLEKPDYYDEYKHMMEMKLIYEYSPFTTQGEVMAQFEKIKGASGTIVVLFNLRRVESGATEMDFSTDKYDIRMTDQDVEREQERNSLRAYLAVLYMDPYMKIHLRGRKVNTIRILSTLSNPYLYHYMAKNLKSCAEKDYKDCERHRLAVQEELNQAKSEYGAVMQKARDQNGGMLVGREAMAEQRRKNMKMTDLETHLTECLKREEEALKAVKQPSPLLFTFGLNIHHRNRYGVMVYNNGRLIDMYVKLAVQKEQNDILMRCLGVVGVVDISKSVLEPTHNKQGFENKREYQLLLKAMNDHMEQYWEDVSAIVGKGAAGVKDFWTNLGYADCLWSSECSDVGQAKAKRFQKTNHCIQCDSCLKWRVIPYQLEYVERGIPDNWKCSDHPRADKRSCDARQNLNELTVYKKGTLKKKKAPEPTVVKASTSTSSLASDKSNLAKATAPPISPPRDFSGPPSDPISSSPPPAPKSPVAIKKKKRRRELSLEAFVNALPPGDSEYRPSNYRAAAKATAVQKDVKEEVEEEEEGVVTRNRAQKAPTAKSTHSLESLRRRSDVVLKEVTPKKARAPVIGDESHGEAKVDAIPEPQKTPPRSNRKRVLSDSESDDDVPQKMTKKVNSRADLRKKLEVDKEVKKEPMEAISPHGGSLANENQPTSVNMEQVKEEPCCKALTQLRTMLETLQRLSGSKHLGEVLKKTDEELVDVNMDQLMDSFAATEIKAPKRQLDNARLDQTDSLKQVYPSTSRLAEDTTLLLKWANQEDPEAADKVAVNTCFEILRETVLDIVAATEEAEENEAMEQEEAEQKEAEGKKEDEAEKAEAGEKEPKPEASQ